MATKIKKPQYTPDNPEEEITTVQQPIPAEDIKELVERVDIDTLKPWKENNQKHSEKDIKKLSANIMTHGQQEPVIVWRKNNVIYNGNGRYSAIKSLGWKFIDVVWRDFQNEAEAIAVSTSVNASQKWNEWDIDNLREQLKSDELQTLVGGDNRYVEFTGFSKKEIDKILLKNEPSSSSQRAEVSPPDKSVIRISCPFGLEVGLTAGLKAYFNAKGWTGKGVKIL